MLDIAVAYNKYKFLGFEFLTWLWHVVEIRPELLSEADPELDSLTLGNRIVLENRLNDGVESVTIKGDDAGLEEGRLALGKGAIVTEMHLVYTSGGHEWRFTIKGESLSLASLKIPETAPLASAEDLEATILEKLFLQEKAVTLMDVLYRRFLGLRLSADWAARTVPDLKKWIQES